MKQWTMPRVEVEGFAANEYVAACAIESILVSGKKYFYWDRNDDNNYNGPHAGENIWYQHRSYYVSDGPKKGWYRNETIWVASNGGSVNMPSGGPYNSSDFRNIGTYDLYFTGSGGKVFIYHAGTAPSGSTPSEEKNFS